MTLTFSVSLYTTIDLNHNLKYTISLRQTTYDVAHTLMPQTGASRQATQQATGRPRLIPTFFVIWIETQGNRVETVAFVGHTND